VGYIDKLEAGQTGRLRPAEWGTLLAARKRLGRRRGCLESPVESGEIRQMKG
jgi:hypothetical protein